tara:strand:- start:759 stop:1019 length:261 start_codon:yes stop_codon:yes gene_type:complete
MSGEDTAVARLGGKVGELCSSTPVLGKTLVAETYLGLSSRSWIAYSHAETLNSVSFFSSHRAIEVGSRATTHRLESSNLLLVEIIP